MMQVVSRKRWFKPRAIPKAIRHLESGDRYYNKWKFKQADEHYEKALADLQNLKYGGADSVPAVLDEDDSTESSWSETDNQVEPELDSVLVSCHKRCANISLLTPGGDDKKGLDHLNRIILLGKPYTEETADEESEKHPTSSIEMAHHYFKEAISIRKRTVKDKKSINNIKKLIASHNRIGDTLVTLKDTNGALKHYQLAIWGYRDGNNDPAAFEQDLMRHLNNKRMNDDSVAVVKLGQSLDLEGQNLREAGDLSGALDRFLEAREIREYNCPRNSLDVALSYFQVGQTLVEKGLFLQSTQDIAMRCFLRALLIQEQHLEATNPKSKSTKGTNCQVVNLLDISKTHYMIGKIHDFQDDSEKALQKFRRALSLAQEYEPIDGISKSARLKLMAQYHTQIGDTMLTGGEAASSTGALSHYNSALTNLGEIEAMQEDCRWEVAEVHSSLGSYHFSLHDFDSALHHYRRALELREEVFETSNKDEDEVMGPSRRRIAVDIAHSRNDIAIVLYTATGEVSEASEQLYKGADTLPCECSQFDVAMVYGTFGRFSSDP